MNNSDTINAELAKFGQDLKIKAANHKPVEVKEPEVRIPRKAIYTVLFGDTDDLKYPTFVTPGWDYYCITDQLLHSDIWKVIPTVNRGMDSNIKKASRRYKILAHEYLAGYDTTLYLDASYLPYGDLDKFIEGKTEGVWLSSHPMRDCAYREGRVVIDKRLDTEEVVMNQLGRYRDEGLPDRFGMWRGGCILRIGDCSKFNEIWWQEVQKGTWRDQVSLPYAAWKTHTKINNLAHGEPNKYFKLYLHKTHELTGGLVRIKDVAEIADISDDKWICLGECDSAEEAIKHYPLVYAIFTENAYIFPRWLYRYLFNVSKMEEHLISYNATYAYWNS